jgi:arylsulfatase A-like enzyme
MSTHDESEVSRGALTRREFMKGSAAALPALGAAAGASALAPPAPGKRPNIIVYIADQFRWDVIGAYGLNSMGLTPNLDGMARRGTLFASHIANQPVCAPSRANLFTSLYQNRNGVWRNGLGLAPGVVTLATVLRQSGYTANYIGKWHLARRQGEHPPPLGWVPPGQRGGFDDFWEGANVLEMTSHPYEGEIYDSSGKPISYSGQYRVDFLTQRALRFLRNNSHQPFLLVVSQLEPHFQNDCNCFVAPHGYAERYSNPFVPADLKFFPGELRHLGIEDNTVVAFVSDHGCHFRTRNAEYKRSPHESSIHIPLVIQGPGFDRALSVPELTCQIDITPSLLQAAGCAIPDTMQGKSFLPLLERRVEGWPNEVYVQISESETGRALRTPQWTYAAVAGRKSQPASDHYEEYQMYNLCDDPSLVHYEGALPMHEAAARLRDRLLERMVEAGEPRAEIQQRELYP